MIALSLGFLVVCIFGAFAYGSATWLAIRQHPPVWGVGRLGPARARPHGVSLAMFAVCTVWFTLNALAETRTLTRGGVAGRSDWVDVAVFLATFLFPPLIMHVVYRDTDADGPAPRGAAWQWAIAVMYVASPAIGVSFALAVLGWLPRPPFLGRAIDFAVAGLFTAACVYSAFVVLGRRTVHRVPARSRLGNAMLALFLLYTALSLALTILEDRSLLAVAFERVSRSAPLLFLIVAMYFENRFDFYDLVIKRGVMLVTAVLALGLAFTLAGPLVDAVPAGPVRPWLTAIIFAPAAMVMPWLWRELSSGLDRLWFGRAFTPVEAVKHLLGAMQGAADEATLIAEAERRLDEMFAVPIAIRLDDAPPPDAREVEVEASTPSGRRVRFVATAGPDVRRLLSEDLAMLRSLAGVFGFMVETVRLQQKRQEQELVARELRLQSSRSELKALRAQINPHFLFNALNAIASLIHTNPARADEAVEQLAEVFRHTLRRSESEWAPLDQELAFARAYLDVEQARFGQRLTCVIESDHGPPAPLVPSMLLQTLIENAVKHGVSQTRGPGRIEVVVRTTASEVVVEVRDNGPGPGVTAGLPRAGEGFGLRSVRERLAGHFGDRARLSLVRDEAAGITVACVVMPVVRVAA